MPSREDMLRKKERVMAFEEKADEGNWLVLMRSPDDRIYSLRCHTSGTADAIVTWLMSNQFKRQDILVFYDSEDEPPEDE
jgi:hypothetical protein